MKKLLTSFITTSARQPIEQVTLDLLQEAHQETTAAAITGIIGAGYDPTKVYLLYGCVQTGTTLYTLTPGAVFCNGEIYLCPGGSGSIGVGNVLVANLVVSYVDTDSISGTQFTDSSFHQVHQIRQCIIGQAASGSGSLSGSASANNDLANFVPLIYVPKFTSSGITIASGWSDVAGSFYPTAYKVNSSGDEVTLCGQIINSSPTSGLILALVLPIASTKEVLFPVLGNISGVTLVQMQTTAGGTTRIYIQSPGTSTTIISLDGIKFRIN